MAGNCSFYTAARTGHKRCQVTSNWAPLGGCCYRLRRGNLRCRRGRLSPASSAPTHSPRGAGPDPGKVQEQPLAEPSSRAPSPDAERLRTWRHLQSISFSQPRKLSQPKRGPRTLETGAAAGRAWPQFDQHQKVEPARKYFEGSPASPQIRPAPCAHLGLPIRGLNRRSFCGGGRPPRTIEIFHREDGRTGGRERGQNFWGSRCRQRAATSVPPKPRRKHFSIRSSESKSAFSPLCTSRPPVLPVKSPRLSTRPTSTAAARSGRPAWPGIATRVSARDLRRGSPRCVESLASCISAAGI